MTIHIINPRSVCFSDGLTLMKFISDEQIAALIYSDLLKRGIIFDYAFDKSEVIE